MKKSNKKPKINYDYFGKISDYKSNDHVFLGRFSNINTANIDDAHDWYVVWSKKLQRPLLGWCSIGSIPTIAAKRDKFEIALNDKLRTWWEPEDVFDLFKTLKASGYAWNDIKKLGL